MWFWPVLILVLIILFVWWALTRQAEMTEVAVHSEHEVQELQHHDEVVVDSGPVDMEPDMEDDLQLIEGIGPKISSVLKSGGIKTFAQLAVLDAEKIREILTNNDPRLGRIADPSTWGEQSKLAAAGKLDELKTLQDNLKGGRAG